MEALTFIFVGLLFLLGAAIGLAIYLIPTIVAVKSDHPNKAAIIVLNILGGWTFIVWVLSLVWALTKPQSQQSRVQKNYFADNEYNTPEPQKANNEQHIFQPQSDEFPVLEKDGKPILVGVKGQFAGKVIDLSQGLVAIGRDPRVSQLSYPYTNNRISRKHCVVAYDQNNKTFILEDESTNGTYIDTGERLNNGRPVYVGPGTQFYLTDPSELYEVRYG